MSDTDTAGRVAFPLRMPRSLHRRLTAEAQRQGISANAVALLALDKHLPAADPRTR